MATGLTSVFAAALRTLVVCLSPPSISDIRLSDLVVGKWSSTIVTTRIALQTTGQLYGVKAAQDSPRRRFHGDMVFMRFVCRSQETETSIARRAECTHGKG